MRGSWRVVGLLGVAALAQGAVAGTAGAATFVASCAGAKGDVSSLVSAINSANASVGADTVQLGSGCTYSLTVADNNWYGPNGLPPITSDITVDGNGATIARAPTVPKFRFFFVAADPASPSTDNYVVPPGTAVGGGRLTLRALTLTGGLAKGGDANEGGGGAGMGGAIFSEGTVVIEQSTFTGNEAQGGEAGNPAAGFGGGGLGTDSAGEDRGGGFGIGTFGGGTGGGGTGTGGGGGGAGFRAAEDGNTATAGAPGAGGGPVSGTAGVGGGPGASGGDGGGGGGGGGNGHEGGAFGSGGQVNAGGGGVGGGGGSSVADGGGGGFGGGGGATYGSSGFGGSGGFGGGGAGGGVGGSSGAGAAGFGGGTPEGTKGGGGAGMGGAIFNMQGQLTVENSTFAGNLALGGTDNVTDHGKGIAGAVFNFNGTFTATASTFVGNTADHYASQIFNLAYDGAQARKAQTTLRDTIVANGSGAANDLATDTSTFITPANKSTDNADVSHVDLVRTMSATIASGEHGSITGSPLTADPLLGPLQGNGGPTQTMAPRPGSPVLDAGSSFGLTTDQRGDPRPVDFSGVSNAAGGDGSDIGAFEVQQACTGQATSDEACHTLTVVTNGAGSVSGSGISCPQACSAAYPASATVTLTATAAAGSRFSGWGGACSGTGSCVVPMSSDRSVTASFTTLGVTISQLRQSASVWREGPALPRISRARKPPVGTVFSFILNEPARVTLTFRTRAGGRKVHQRCVAPTRKNRHSRRCTRIVIAGAVALTGHAGLNRISFAGHLSRTHRLKPGRYTLTITASGPGGLRSTSGSLTFTIVR